MSSQVLKDLREEMSEKLYKHMGDMLDGMSGRDSTEMYLELVFSGCKGVENESDEEFLTAYKDDMWEHYEVDGSNNYINPYDNSAEIRELADKYELELVVEKELLTE